MPFGLIFAVVLALVLTGVVFRVAVFSPAVATGAVIASRIAIVGATATAASATTPATPAALIATTATVGWGCFAFLD